ncbi:MAG: hypothetical protein HC919_04225 [Oscillatoriales cyanobacterium SM2_2_1]|nr:hypothetical protein [Oscillatoriales cyanobacterium SM2_2_1]
MSTPFVLKIPKYLVVPTYLIGGLMGGLNTIGFASAYAVPQKPTQPSLWWRSQRLDANWVETITTNEREKYVDITINIARWSTADLMRRYTIINFLAQDAIRQGYGLRLLDRRGQELAQVTKNGDRWQIIPPDLRARPFRPQN